MSLEKEKFGNSVLIAGFIAGTLDATAASIQYYINTGNNPARVFRYVASAAFGKEISTENLYGWAACGLVLHFLIAFSFTLFFFLVYPQVKKILPNKFLTGIVYGLFIWAVMNLAVVPLSFGRPVSIDINKAAIAAMILIAAIGIPVSFLADRYYSKK
jgi:hypothetical protein